MHLKIPHKFNKEEALKRVKDALDKGRKDLAAHAEVEEERWEGETLHFAGTIQGQHISGSLEVGESDFTLDATLPLLWRMFEGRIERAIEGEVKKML
jgi:hypothetical protein